MPGATIVLVLAAKDYVGADDLRRLLGDDFTVERHAVEPRIDALPGTPHIADVVLRARRR